MTDTVFEAAMNNRAPGQKDEAKICSDRLAQVDGWQREGINESTGPPTHEERELCRWLDVIIMWLCVQVCVYV